MSYIACLFEVVFYCVLDDHVKHTIVKTTIEVVINLCSYEVDSTCSSLLELPWSNCFINIDEKHSCKRNL